MYLPTITGEAKSGGSEDNPGSNGLSEPFESGIVFDDI